MFVYRVSQRFFDDMRAVWDALPKDEVSRIPRKSSFSPKDMKEYLGNLGIMEHLGDGRMSFRLVGSSSRDFWGLEWTGSEYHFGLSGHNVPDEAIVPQAIIEALFTHPCGMLSLREAYDSKGTMWQAEILALPMADDEGKPHYLLYGYRVLVGDEIMPNGWVEGELDLSTAKLLSAKFIDIGHGIPS